jgi:hypothetical protein
MLGDRGIPSDVPTGTSNPVGASREPRAGMGAPRRGYLFGVMAGSAYRASEHAT